MELERECVVAALGFNWTSWHLRDGYFVHAMDLRRWSEEKGISGTFPSPDAHRQVKIKIMQYEIELNLYFHFHFKMFCMWGSSKGEL